MILSSSRVTTLVIVAVISWFVASPAVLAAEPTIEQVQADYKAGSYQDALRKISLIISSPNSMVRPAPASPERYDLLMLRGESALALKQRTLAIDSFNSAFRSARTEQDIARPARAYALITLTKGSPGFKYPAGGAKEGGIDIVSPGSRTKAVGAMYEDRLKDIKPQVEKAMRDTSLVPIHKLLPALRELYALEVTATGKTAESEPLLKSLGGHARKLMTEEVARLNKRLDVLNDLASSPTITRSSDSIGYRGLTSPERDELQEIADYLDKIAKAAQEGRAMAKRLGGDVAAWDAIIADVDEGREIAKQAYDRRY